VPGTLPPPPRSSPIEVEHESSSKTFVAETHAKECGLTTIKLKNFRSKWVGATEGNLEKILNVIRASAVVVIIDEGDRASATRTRRGTAARRGA